MPTKAPAKKAKKKEAEKDLSRTYNEFKEFEGQQYTGMKVGRSHKWYYDKGVWKETKITPDLWEIAYAVTKRRAGKAPEGSGVPVGTEYHWYILAHQNVRKLDANSYTTTLTGLKYKLAHRRADKDKWNVSARAQRKRLIKVMQDLIAQLEKEPEELPEENTVDASPEKPVVKKAATAKAASRSSTTRPGTARSGAAKSGIGKPATAAKSTRTSKTARKTRKSKQPALALA
ncbi:MAG TPA: hypothetical protein VD993_10540 [Chitinophagaceae bacterium]|nr:hypothetical protein [Chitinophagaceae bacterium]